MTNREYAEYWFRASPVPKIEDYEHGLEAAERRGADKGWARALEWSLSQIRQALFSADPTRAIEDELARRRAELKAEENKR